jgi:hypothetical protein
MQDINTVGTTKEAQLDWSKELGQEVNAHKIKYVLISQ